MATISESRLLDLLAQERIHADDAIAKVARLTAALDRISWDLDDDDPTEIARDALSAEAGDTDAT
jgi:hypothetical protein